MAVPDFQSIMVPLLKANADGQPHKLAASRDAIGECLQLTTADFDERLSNGTPLFANRIAWAATHLAKAGALERVGGFGDSYATTSNTKTVPGGFGDRLRNHLKHEDGSRKFRG